VSPGERSRSGQLPDRSVARAQIGAERLRDVEAARDDLPQSFTQHADLLDDR
jgi:hypothetical protein